MKKALVIYNPMSGAKKLLNSREIIQDGLKKAGYEIDFHETIKAKKQDFSAFKDKKYDRIVVAGGDGTVNEVIGFLITNKIKSPLVIIPQGSANILAHALGLPLLAKRALEKGLKSEGKKLDAMLINKKHHGMIAAGIGYDAVLMSETSRKMKRKIGFLAYLWTFFSTVFDYRSRAYKVAVDGKRQSVLAKSIVCFNVLPFGETAWSHLPRGSKISGHDGTLNVLVMNPGRLRKWFYKTPRFQLLEGKQFSIQSKKVKRFQIDGEAFKGNSITIDVLEKAINIAY